MGISIFVGRSAKYSLMIEFSVSKIAGINLSGRKKLIEAMALSLIFFIVEFILVHYHEIWGDEIHSWAIARTSHSLGELMYNTRYEGHPKLWYILLYMLQKFTRHIFYMQILSVAIASCTVFVFAFFSPFSLLQNILICSGYFFTYEYSIISRNYGIGLFLLFLCAGLYTTYKEKYLWLVSILLFLLFETNVYEVIIGTPFYCYIIWSLYKTNDLKWKPLFISAAIVLAGIIVFAITVKPPWDSGVEPWITHITVFDCCHVLSTVFTSYCPIMEFNFNYWEGNLLSLIPGHIFIQASLGVIILVFISILFWKERMVLLLFYTGTFGVMFFTLTKNFGWVRHHGHLYILFILCYWLYYSKHNIDGKPSQGYTKYFILVILLVQVAGAAWANIADIKYTFSNDMPGAEYIKANLLDTLPLMGDADYAVSGIAGILDRDIYFYRPNYWARWILLNRNWGTFIDFSEDDLLYKTDSILLLKKSDGVVILSYPFYDPRLVGWKSLETFKNSAIGEDYYLYQVKYIQQDLGVFCSDGEVLENRGQIGQAIKTFRKVIELDSLYSRGYMEMGAVLFNQGDAQQALGYFIKAVKLAPEEENGYICTATCYIKQNNYDSAISYLKGSIKIAPDDTIAYRLISKCHKGLEEAKRNEKYNKIAEGIEEDKK